MNGISKAPYIPTPEEIRERSLEVQATWTEAERRRREHGRHGDGDHPVEHWTPPVVPAAMLPLAPDATV